MVITREYVRARLGTLPALKPPRHSMPPLLRKEGKKPEGGLIAAAVLVPLVDHTNGLTVMLTVRPDHLAYHPGQISFPGGRAEAGESAIQTALREAREEIGLREKQVEILGALADYTTLTGYRITPVVGLVDPGFAPVPDPVEVAEVFEVPLAHFLDANNHQRHRAVYEGSERQYYAMPFETRFIWGATAGMLYDFYRVLTSTEEETSEC